MANELGIDLFYDSVELDAVLNAVQPPTSFFDSLFFGPSRYKFINAKSVVYDARSGSQTLAPYIHPRIGNKVVERGGYKSNIISLPTIAPSMIITVDNLEKRLFGEMFNTKRSYQSRLEELQLEDVAEMRRMIQRRREQQAVSLVLTGKVEIIGEGINAVVDFWDGLTNAEKPFVDVGALDPDLYWGGTDANPIADLRAARSRASKAQGATPTMAILGSGAADELLKDEELLKRLDNRGINAGFIDVEFLPNGVTRLGYLAEVGLWLYTYDGEIYNETTKQSEPVVPPNMVILASPQADTRRYFGNVSMVNPHIHPPRFDIRNKEYNSNSYMQTSPEQGVLTEVKTATLPVIRQVQEFQVIKVKAN